jgi:RNA polymerase sigma factor (TIGR02999 family)
MAEPPGEITAILQNAHLGKEEAFSQLIPLVYQELRKLAGFYLRNQRAGHTLQPTALVHDVYLRLAGQETPVWNNRDHFFASTARIMRNLLVDHARARSRKKREGGMDQGSLEQGVLLPSPDLEDVLALDSALDRLAEIDARAARVVELRYFVGLNTQEVADAMGVTTKTIQRDWNLAKTWLQAELGSLKLGG